ncbi:MAG: exodeoxyribonuclease VII large subunit [Tissierellia bacterium]|nr:exodeoxyribonuclease VII large subunit [Tissierellia bacterium]
MEPITVSKLNGYIRDLLKNDLLLGKVKVQGEVTNCTDHKSGHIYFSLKDETAKIKAVFFKWDNTRCAHKIKTGDNIIATGSIDYFERDGSIQLYVKNVEPAGKGDLFRKFEELKVRLEDEGLFSSETKRPIPSFPKTIGVITADTGAAIHDIITVSKRRNPNISIMLYPSLVQGINAPTQLILGLKYLDSIEAIDVIIIGRGGGSFEELNAFNDEQLARAIHKCSKPIVSAVGHETDFTIADFVADLRAATPSAAAEQVVYEIDEVNVSLDQKINYIKLIVDNRISTLRVSLDKFKNEMYKKSPVGKLSNYKAKCERIPLSFELAMQKILTERKSKLSEIGYGLSKLDPEEPLKRGFAYITNEKARRISLLSEARKQSKLTINMQDGSAEFFIQDKEESYEQ